MSLSSELEVLSKRVQDLKKEVRRALLRSLGVDRLVKRAFVEGWQMGQQYEHEVHCNVIHPLAPVESGCDCGRPNVWRSVDEAFVNSDVEEEV